MSFHSFQFQIVKSGRNQQSKWKREFEEENEKGKVKTLSIFDKNRKKRRTKMERNSNSYTGIDWVKVFDPYLGFRLSKDIKLCDPCCRKYF